VSTLVREGDDVIPEIKTTRSDDEVGSVGWMDDTLRRRIDEEKQQRAQVMTAPLVQVNGNIDSVKVLNKPMHYREGMVLTPSRVQGDISGAALDMGGVYTDNVGVQVGVQETAGHGELLDMEAVHAPAKETGVTTPNSVTAEASGAAQAVVGQTTAVAAGTSDTAARDTGELYTADMGIQLMMSTSGAVSMEAVDTGE
jgi:hypothetical protein